MENSNPGTSGWQLSNPAISREIEGFASLTSVNIGGSIDFLVSTADSSFKIEIFRTGWYGGVGARLLMTVNNVAGGIQATPTPDPVTGLIECKWTKSYTLSVPTSWVSGIFLARLTGNQSGKQSYIIFVVRDDARSSAILFESAATTFQAYNFWPNGANGKSLYDWAPGHRAWKVSFNRPYVIGDSYSSSTPGASSGIGAGDFLTNLYPGPAQGYPIPPAGWEYNMVRWLEKNGYDVTYLTGIDLHENANLLTNHSALLSIGHNEYWSANMRQNVQNAMNNNGLNVGFFSSNSVYWQVRFEPAFNGAADRTMVCYKYDAATNDPDYSSNPSLATVEWRQSPVNQPEAALQGNEYVGDPVESDIVISNASHWLMNGTGLQNGSHLTGILGYEVDVMVPGTSPPNTVVLASSPVGPFSNDFDNPPGFSCNTQQCNSNVTWYSTGHAFVFATGSLQWSWGLDDYNAPSLRNAYSSAAAQTLTANVLGAFITPVTVTTASLPAGTAGVAYSAFQLTASGGGLPYTWTSSGLPSGMNLSSSGVLSGTPAAAGTFPVTFTATDAASKTGSKPLNLVVNPSYTISGQITLSGSGLAGVTVTLSTGPTTTTNSSGNYSFNNLPTGTYTVTPSLSGYSFTPSSQTFTNITSNQTANFTATIVTLPARAVSINFVGTGTTMGASESAGVVAKTNWNNATGNKSSSALNLVDETGALNGASATWNSDVSWNLPITDSAGSVRMMRGYIDSLSASDSSTVTITGLPASPNGYDIYVYTDGDNQTGTEKGSYQLSGSGITTASFTATDLPNTNFSGTFTQAINSGGNYVKFTAVHATAFTITATPATSSDGIFRAPVNGIQIIPSAAPGTARTVGIKLVGTGAAMGASETAGVVAKTNWNNATGNNSSSPLSLVDETGAVNGASATWVSDVSWNLPITDSAGNVRMMRGYIDSLSASDSSSVNVTGLPPSSTGYDIYVYTDGDNQTGTEKGNYQLTGPGIATASFTATDLPNANFSGTFKRAINSAGNYVKFTAVQATTFTITATPAASSDGVFRAPINSIQIVPSPAPGTARTVSINFVGAGTSMGATESAGVIAKTNWNNAASNNSSSPLSLVDETGAANGAAVTWASDVSWNLPITDSAGNVRMMRGYIDSLSGSDSNTVTVADLPPSATGYDIYVYTDGDNATATKTATYQLSGAGITAASTTVTDSANTNFSGAFTQANNSAGNYVKFAAIQATSFTITATPKTSSNGALRAPVNGIQVIPH